MSEEGVNGPEDAIIKEKIKELRQGNIDEIVKSVSRSVSWVGRKVPVLGRL